MVTTTISPVDGRYKRVADSLRKDGAAISPIETIYKDLTEGLREVIGEKSLARNRIVVEGENLIFLSKRKLGVRPLSDEEIGIIRELYNVTDDDVDALKAIEFKGWNGIKATNHDIKAVEYFIKKKLENTSLKDVLEWVHFPLTSEDTNSVAYGLMLSDSLGKVIVPKLELLSEKIGESGSLGKKTKLALDREIKHLKDMSVLVKYNGAVGDYNAHSVAFPNVDLQGWLSYTTDFVSGFNDGRVIPLKPNLITTQIEPHDNYAEIFNTIKRANTTLNGFISKMREEHVSSNADVMAHFKETDVSLNVANSLSSFFSAKLPISRLQRDLSDSTVERNLGVALAYSLIGYSLLTDSLEIKDGKRTPNVVREELVATPVEGLGLSYKLDSIMIPKIKELRNTIGSFAKQHAGTPIGARTHGQLAVPTTFGKAFHVDEERINKELKKLEKITDVDSYNGAAEVLDSITTVNTIVINFTQNIWRYISDNWILQKVVEGEVGSSTMAQKINPINFENSEGNAGVSNAFLTASSTALLLFGDTNKILRGAMDEGLSYALISYDAALKGLGKISVNEKEARKVLDAHPEMLAEPIQIILKRAGVPGAYELLKAATRGREVTQNDIDNLINNLKGVSEEVKKELRGLKTATYIGMAEGLVGIEG